MYGIKFIMKLLFNNYLRDICIYTHTILFASPTFYFSLLFYLWKDFFFLSTDTFIGETLSESYAVICVKPFSFAESLQGIFIVRTTLVSTISRFHPSHIFDLHILHSQPSPTRRIWFEKIKVKYYHTVNQNRRKKNILINFLHKWKYFLLYYFILHFMNSTILRNIIP